MQRIFPVVDPSEIGLRANPGCIFSPGETSVALSRSVHSVYNMGAIKINPGEPLWKPLSKALREESKEWKTIGRRHGQDSPFILLGFLRVDEIKKGVRKSSQHLVVSPNGRDSWKIQEKPILSPLNDQCRGFEDIRALSSTVRLYCDSGALSGAS